MKTKSSSRVSRRFSDNPFAKNIHESEEEDLLMDYERFDTNANKRLSKSTMSTPKPSRSSESDGTSGADKPHKKDKKKKNKEIRQPDQEDEWEISAINNNFNTNFGMSADKPHKKDKKKNKEIRQEEDEWGEIRAINNNTSFGGDNRRKVDLSQRQQDPDDEWETSAVNNNTNNFGRRVNNDKPPKKTNKKNKEIRPQQDEWETSSIKNNGFGRVDDKPHKKSKKKNKEIRREEEDDDAWGETSAIRNNNNGGFGGDKRRKEVDLSQVPPHLFRNMVKATPKHFTWTEDDINQEDVEGWIIQCPRNVNLKAILEGKKLSLKDGASSILSEGQGNTYEIVTSKKASDGSAQSDKNAVIILPDGERHFKMTSIPLHGSITIRTHLDAVYPPEVVIPRKKGRKLPRGIKQRHPIYGVNFSEALSGVKVTQTRSLFYPPSPTKTTTFEDDFIEKLTFSKSKSRKRKSSISIPQEIVPQIPQEKDEPPSKKSSKKRKLFVEEPEILEIPEYYISPKKEKKKSKKIKHDD